MNYRFPLATSTWGNEEHDAIQSVIKSDIYTMGNRVHQFEKDFAQYLGSKYCVMVNSGSSANLLMIAALFYTQNPLIKLKRGDEVIVPAVSWSTTYYPLYQYGLKIKFVDIDLETLNYDLDQLEQAVTGQTRMIMVVNLLGNPNNYDRIQEIIDQKNIIFIEDNCESLGAKFNNKFSGTFGLMGSFSSYFSHHISTMEGGLIVTDNEELHHILLSIRSHGWTRNLPRFNHVTGLKSDDPFEESFRFVLPGYNVRPLEIEGAVGIEQLKRLPSIIEERRKNGLKLQQIFSNHPEIMIQREIGQSSWFGFSLITKPSSHKSRKDMLIRLNQLGFECRPIVAGNFAKNEVIKYFDYEIFGSLKNADYIDQKGLFIGNHHYPISEALDALSKF
jgi:CDP-6-deoxy-D-xylo-4-hexulose-3-dehydrase